MLKNLFIQPFSLFFARDDIHIMLYFKGHPQYESIEAMVQKRKGREHLVRAIITYHDQSQTDYINDEIMVEEMKSEGVKREIYFAPIKYFRNPESEKPILSLGFETIKHEFIDFVFHSAGPPLQMFSGLINPESHSIKTELPLMYRDRSTLSSPKSTIKIDGVNYAIPKKIWIPIFFTGMKGYYSENFSIGIFRSNAKNLRIIQIPKSLSAGEKWIYQADRSTEIYEITERNRRTVIRYNNQKIAAYENNGSFEINNIVLSDGGNIHNGKFLVEFKPGLSLNRPRDKIKFSLSIDNHDRLVEGVIKSVGAENKFRIVMIPEHPKWAVNRIVLVEYKKVGKEIQVNNSILNNTPF